MFDLDFGGIDVADVVTDVRVPVVPAGVYAVHIVDCDLKQITGKDGTKYPPVTHIFFEILEGPEQGRLIDIGFSLADKRDQVSQKTGKPYTWAQIAHGQVGRIYKAVGVAKMGKLSEIKGKKFLLGVKVREKNGYESNEFESAMEYRPAFNSALVCFANGTAQVAPAQKTADPFNWE
jgi:hypothetical protein